LTGRLALFGDVHANLPALMSVLDAIAAAGIGAGACTGDLVLRGTGPEACVAAVRSLGWPCAAGNTDRKVAKRPPRPPDHPAAQRVGSRSWTRHRLSEESVRYLAELPALVRFEHDGVSVVVLHGGGEDHLPSIDETSNETMLSSLAADLGADVVVSGHTHRPLVRRVGGCLFVNPGSVGEGEEHDQRPAWAWLAVEPSGPAARLERVPYALAAPREHR